MLVCYHFDRMSAVLRIVGRVCMCQPPLVLQSVGMIRFFQGCFCIVVFALMLADI